jgi:NAD(P)-dependent dehydrogenase (short-subunit alcohol dehydrogenase family)
LINNAGINIINWLERFHEDDWDKVMDTNAKGIYLMSKACLPALKDSKGTIVNIVSNAAHMPMTCSLAYNASKGAAHIMTRQLARELTKKDGITVFGIAPNKLEGTRMSESIDKQVVDTRGWTPFEAHKYQLAGLVTGEETPPALVAEFVTFLLSSKERHKFLSGCIIPYGA